jgi:hypothetical protein
MHAESRDAYESLDARFADFTETEREVGVFETA